jgi:hypothetical protein
MKRLLGALPLLARMPNTPASSGVINMVQSFRLANRPSAYACEMPAPARTSAIMANRNTEYTACRPVVQAARACVASR